MARYMRAVVVASALVLIACSPASTSNVTRAQPETVAVRWDANLQGENWTEATLRSLDAYGSDLVKMVPGDVEIYCPTYASLDEDDRKAFWANLIASLAYHESTWRPEVAGGGGRWVGLLQISPQTARTYGCRAHDAGTLKDGAANVSCGVRIMSETVSRDGVISEGRRGIAADWGPFQQAGKRQDIQSYTRALPYCRT